MTKPSKLLMERLQEEDLREGSCALPLPAYRCKRTSSHQPERPGFSSNTLPLNLILLIEVTFSTPTGGYTQVPTKGQMSSIKRDVKKKAPPRPED